MHQQKTLGEKKQTSKEKIIPIISIHYYQYESDIYINYGQKQHEKYHKRKKIVSYFF